MTLKLAYEVLNKVSWEVFFSSLFDTWFENQLTAPKSESFTWRKSHYRFIREYFGQGSWFAHDFFFWKSDWSRLSLAFPGHSSLNIGSPLRNRHVCSIFFFLNQYLTQYQGGYDLKNLITKFRIRIYFFNWTKIESIPLSFLKTYIKSVPYIYWQKQYERRTTNKAKTESQTFML